MSEKGLTNISVKKINRSKVYQYIYRKKITSKLQIVQDLQMGLSTVSQNLNLLEQDGLIEKNGYFESTGGRKANAIQIVSDFRISIGIGILKNMFHITACTEIHSIPIPFHFHIPTRRITISRSPIKSKNSLPQISMMKKRYLVFPSLHKESPPLITLLCCMEIS